MTLLCRAFNISSSWKLFHQEIQTIKSLLQKNSYPPDFIEKEIKLFLNSKLEKCSKNSENKNEKSDYFKLPYLGDISICTKKKVSKLCKRFCKNKIIQLVFVPFKVGDIFSVKDTIPNTLKSYVVYKFSCAGCNSCYIGETKRHLTTRIKEHLGTDKNSHIYQHLNKNDVCKNSASTDCFTIIDSASSSFRLKMKEALHITWCKPDLNKQVNHVSMTLNF